MKKIFLLAFVLPFVLLSCEEGEAEVDRYDKILLHSFIIDYVEGTWTLYESTSNAFVLNLDKNTFGACTVYTSPDITGKESAKFTEIATRNGDLSYNRSENWLSYYMSRACPAERFSRIIVKGFKADWDEEHPRGSDISDLVTVKLHSCADYIRSGYKGEQYKTIEKRATRLTENDLTLFSVYWKNSPVLSFDTLPAPDKEFVIEVTLVTTEGKTYKAYYRNDGVQPEIIK